MPAPAPIPPEMAELTIVYGLLIGVLVGFAIVAVLWLANH
jgi:hypothetical protein